MQAADIWHGTNVTSYAFFVFQAMFAATAATIVSGAVGERIKFSGYLAFTFVMLAAVYPLVAHWVWDGGLAAPYSSFGAPFRAFGVAGAAARKVTIRALKEFASERLPKGSALRDLLLTEKDELTAEEFLSKMDVWIRVFNWEFSRQDRTTAPSTK
jgi:hypothetical protein